MKKYYKILLLIIFVWGLSTIIISCEKFVDVPIPTNAVTGPAVFTSDATAVASLNGLYVTMADASFIQGIYGLSLLTGVASDELDLYSPTVLNVGEYYRNNLSNQSTAIHWQAYYSYMQTLNSILDGLSKSTLISEPIKKQLEGEAKFLRAFFYFYLVNLYGDVPLLLTSDWRINSTASRKSKDQVWQQIIQDLKEAQNLLSDKYLQGDAKTPYSSGSEQRVRPTKWAASTLLARAYLYTKDWVNAEAQSTALINSNYFTLLPDLNSVFLKNSREAIWQLMSVNPTQSTKEATVYILSNSGFNEGTPSYMSSRLLNAFESNDKRNIVGNWVNSKLLAGNTRYFPYKYKETSPVSNGNPREYFMVLRLAELYLTRGEARAHQNNLSSAIADLDMIRQRAGLPLLANTYPGISQTALLDAILHERQVEFFAEGHRWLDLKRTGVVDAIMSITTPQKANGMQWQSYKQYWPINYKDLQLDPNLTQTPGY